MKTSLLSTTWWLGTLSRALRTAVTIALPYLGASTLFAGVPWLSAASAAGLGFVLSLLTSVISLATEGAGPLVPVWYALALRVAKTVAQALIAGVGNAVFFTDVHWATVLQASLLAGFAALLLNLLSVLPAVTSTPPAASRILVPVNYTPGVKVTTLAPLPAPVAAPNITVNTTSGN